MALVAVSCNKATQQEQPDWNKYKNTTDNAPKPLDAPYRVVAHRGGSIECNKPDNSIASLEYAMNQKCFASECDIYWTKDNKVVVAHADGSCCINGLRPWESTLAQIRAAGKLTNGEQVPSLEDFIDKVMTNGSCTRLWLDIKNSTVAGWSTDYAINAAKCACDIIKEKNAKNYVEFICTGNGTVMKAANDYAYAVGAKIGWMGSAAPATFIQNGYTWANFCAASTMSSISGGTGARTVDEFVEKGLEISVYNVDKMKYDANAVYSESAVNYYINNYEKMRAICTNFPAWMIDRLTKAGKK